MSGPDSKYMHDRATNYFFQPHSITVMVISCLAVWYFAYWIAPEAHAVDSHTNVRGGVFAVVFVLFGWSALNMQERQGSGPTLIRPHPAIWRGVLGLNLGYVLLLSFLACQKPSDIRLWLSWADPTLGKPLPEQSYAESCRLVTPDHALYLQGGFVRKEGFRSLFSVYVPSQLWYCGDLMDAIFDEFVLAHFLGWFGKALVIRDFTVLLSLSVLFEFVEVDASLVRLTVLACFSYLRIC